MMDETDFPEYGRQCEMLTPWRGYHRGTIVPRLQEALSCSSAVAQR